MRSAELAGKRVAVWGFGREGIAAAKFLRRRFPNQPSSLICAPAQAAAAREIAGSEIDLITHDVDAQVLQRFDVVIKSPGISPYQAAVITAQASGVRFTSGTALWFAEHVDARTICVTGTKGKSTVTALIAHLLRQAGKRVALAGNIGLPLLDLIDVDTPVDHWVIELSSFQTRDAQASPHVLTINNLYPEHLDWHQSEETYYADKLALVPRAQHLVVNAAHAGLLTLTAAHPQRTLFGDTRGWHVAEGAVWRGQRKVLELGASPLRGEHNAQNLCAALASLEVAEEDAIGMAPHVASFRALPHRLQLLGMRDAITYVNDSIATTPYATLEALRSFPSSAVTLLIGGFDRGVSWEEFAHDVTLAPPHAIITMGANGTRISDSLRAHPLAYVLEQTATLEAAFVRAQALTPKGGIVLLSPGAPSFDQFHDYTERGRAFAQLAGFDSQQISGIEGLGIA